MPRVQEEVLGEMMVLLALDMVGWEGKAHSCCHMLKLRRFGTRSSPHCLVMIVDVAGLTSYLQTPKTMDHSCLSICPWNPC